MNTKNFLLLICATTFLISCKKEEKQEQSPTPKSTAEMIQAKWKVEKIISYYYYNDPIDWSMNTTNGTAADYFDFRSDSSLYTSIAGVTDTTSYSVQSSSRLLINGQFHVIKELSDETLKIYVSHDLLAPMEGDLMANEIYLKK